MKTSVLAGCCHNCEGPSERRSGKWRATKRRAGADCLCPSASRPTGQVQPMPRNRCAGARRGRTIPPVSYRFRRSAGSAGSAGDRRRRAGRVSPRQDQPENRKAGSSICLMNPRQARSVSAPPARRSNVTVPNLLSMTPAASSSRPPSGSILAANAAVLGMPKNGISLCFVV